MFLHQQGDLYLQVNLNGFYWIKAITHLQLLPPGHDYTRQNMRTYVGEYPKDPINPLFPSALCHQTERWVHVPDLTRYNCSKPLYGKYIYLDTFGELN